jgi:hypothetical protein
MYLQNKFRKQQCVLPQIIVTKDTIVIEFACLDLYPYDKDSGGNG